MTGEAASAYQPFVARLASRQLRSPTHTVTSALQYVIHGLQRPYSTPGSEAADAEPRPPQGPTEPASWTRSEALAAD